jgi:LPS-assembly lipoprotein
MSWCRERAFAFAALICSGAILAACGFHPLYGTANPEVEPALASIKIVPMGPQRTDQDVARIGQELRNMLYTRLNPKGEPAQPKYVLDAKLGEAKESLAIQKTEVATRAILSIVANYRLTQAGTGEIVFQAESRSTASYDLVESEYANVVAAQDAERRVLQNISDDMTAQISFHFTQDIKQQREAQATAIVPGAPAAVQPSNDTAQPSANPSIAPNPPPPANAAPAYPSYPGYQAYPAYPSAEYPSYQAPPTVAQPYQPPYQPAPQPMPQPMPAQQSPVPQPGPAP